MADERRGTPPVLLIALGVIAAVGILFGGLLAIDLSDGSSGSAAVPVPARTPQDATGLAQDVTATTASPPSPELIRRDAGLAAAAFVSVLGPSFGLVELVLYDDYAILEVPAAEGVARYSFRRGMVDAPTTTPAPPGTDAEVFSIDEVRFDLISGMAQQGLDAFEVTDERVTHVIIGRFLPFDERVTVRVYVSGAVGSGGYVLFTATGELVRVVS